MEWETLGLTLSYLLAAEEDLVPWSRQGWVARCWAGCAGFVNRLLIVWASALSSPLSL